MSQIIIRNLSDATINALNAIAEASGMSRQQYLHDLLTATAARVEDDDSVIAGFVAVTYLGDIDMEEACPLCGRSFEDGGGQYLMIRTDARPAVPVCAACAGDYSSGD